MTGEGRVGRPIAQCSPHDLEVHPAGTLQDRHAGSRAGSEGLLSGYVVRDHDQVLAEVVHAAAQGRSHMTVLVGSSSTGKTRACWEAVRPLAQAGWWLWHPFAPTRAEAALAGLHAVPPGTVVWLNEAQHFLGDPARGERIAAALHGLLTDTGRGPVLVLGTLWPQFARQYLALPQPGEEDPHSRVRELLAARMLSVPEAFDREALDAAAALAGEGDVLLADALARAGASGRITQDLAGAPELLHRYRHGSPAAVALLEAAMDARRLGVGLYLPQAFLTDAAVDYLDEVDYAQLDENWVESAFAELTRLVHGKQAPLSRTTPRPRHRSPASGPLAGSAAGMRSPLFQLSGYLEQHGRATRRRLCPPASFWNAAFVHLMHADDLSSLARAARARYRLQWADHLQRRAAEAGEVRALLAQAARCEQAADWAGAKALYRRAADGGHPRALALLAEVHEQADEPDVAEALAWQAAADGHPRALTRIAGMREGAGNRSGAQAVALRAADAGHGQPLIRLTALRETRGERDDAEATARLAADRGHPQVLAFLGGLREAAEDLASAQVLYRQAADAGHSYALVCLAVLHEEAGNPISADDLALEAAEAGHTRALTVLAGLRAEAGHLHSAEALCRKAADSGCTHALVPLAELREGAGDLEDAEALYRQAADAGHTHSLLSAARLREKAGDPAGAETLYRRAADAGHTSALTAMAALRENAGDPAGAEALAWQAADAGTARALLRLAAVRSRADPAGAEALARQAIDAGYVFRVDTRRASPHERWPHGLDPDGTPTPPWH
ncbi:tetratricopeptide repeat protein [Streptomyces hokutonensis]|uniref:tetratricopeptide repeat protein n=1 Tax=Streptomyces hokutonensis TaxID=1306990 RepID=UPI00131A48ED|nr:hypothetical protein [Streptomyces hokutonensis]